MLNPERSKLLNLLDLNKDIASAKGAWLTSTCGEVYLDFTSQYGAVPFGFNPDFLQQQLIEQVNTNAAVMVQPFFSQGAKELSDLLIEIAPEGLKYVTFACTGAEVVEAAIKLAKSGTNRKKILSTLNSFHGKTMGAALATGNAYYKEEFYSDNASFLHIPYDDLEALELALSGRKIAAFIVEPVQGEGGMIEPSPGYLQGCQALCAHYNTLFVVDEIQTGLGRTGELFVSLKEGITPDILLVGKALGGGMLPISACIANEKAWSTDFGLRHSSTFANNHLAAHMGIGTIKALREQHEILENVNNMGHYLREQLEKLVARYPEVYTGCSGRGLMQGLMLSPWRDPQSYVPCCVYEFGYAVAIVSSYLLNQNHILTVPTLNANNVLRIQPNYFVEQGMIDRFIEALNEVAEIIKQGQFVRLLRNAIGLTAPMPNQDLPPLRLPRQAPPEPTQDEPYRGRFAFFIHPTTEEEGVDGLCAEISQFSPEERERARTWMNECSSLSPIAVPAYHIPCFASDDGGYIDGWLIASFLSPRDMMRLNKAEKTKLLTGYIEQAKALGVDRIGLGAFTSVISRSGTLVADSGVDVTTGNSYTALTSTDAVRQIVHHSGRSLSTMQLGVVGALGSVGRLCLLDLAGECASINLIGNARNKDRLSTLKSLAGEMLLSLVNADKPNAIPILMRLASVGIDQQWMVARSGDQSEEAREQLFDAVTAHYQEEHGSMLGFPVILGNGITKQLPQCDVVITATSNGEAFITPELLGANAIVCDVARPSDVASGLRNTRPDVIAIEGGLVNLPDPISFGRSNIVGLPEGISIACLCETMILTMQGVTGNYSIGMTPSLDEARQIFAWGSQHGFATYIPEEALAAAKQYSTLEPITNTDVHILDAAVIPLPTPMNSAHSSDKKTSPTEKTNNTARPAH